jgi:hypothetical protein
MKCGGEHIVFFHLQGDDIFAAGSLLRVLRVSHGMGYLF